MGQFSEDLRMLKKTRHKLFPRGETKPYSETKKILERYFNSVEDINLDNEIGLCRNLLGATGRRRR